MSIFQFKAEKREKLGSSEARRIRKAGNIPAIIISKKGNLNITLNSKDFEVEFKKGNIQARVAEIEIDGKKINSIAKSIELDPVSDRVIHVDFINLDEAENIRAWPKTTIVNRDKSSGLKKGGFLNIRLRKVEVICDNIAKIPESVEIDVSKLSVGDKVRKDDITLPEGVNFATQRNFLLVSVTGRGKAEEETPATGAEGAAQGTEGAAATPAEGDKKEESDKK